MTTPELQRVLESAVKLLHLIDHRPMLPRGAIDWEQFLEMEGERMRSALLDHDAAERAGGRTG